jgi:hypothetical protein
MSLIHRRRLGILVLFAFLAGCGRSSERPADRTPLVPAEKLADTDVLPYSQGAITAGRNYVYCSTFQIAWEEMQKTLSGGPIQLTDDPELADLLNRNPFDRKNLAEKSYLAMGGKIEQGVVDQIRSAMKNNFPDSTMDVPPASEKEGLYLFSYLSKSAQFKEVFDRLETPLTFHSGGKTAEVIAFGVKGFEVSSDRDRALCRQMTVLDYQSNDDFVISLNSTSEVDQIILAKIKPESTLQATIESVETRIKNSTLEEYEREPFIGECLMVPVIALGVERTYCEILGKRLRNTGWEAYYITGALQGIRFRLDEFGAKLESTSTVACKSAMPSEPRQFIFDKPFLLYVKEKSATAPYFAMWIETPELLQKSP